MGLTIHYALRWAPRDGELAQEFVERLRSRIGRARIGRASALREVTPEELVGRVYLRLDGANGEWAEVAPRTGWLFTLEVGADCEPVELGLCRYPEAHRFRPLPQLRGWRLRSFSKTQYASLHGWEHFRKCHLRVLRALEIARECGARVKISDEGDYWPGRSERALRRNVDQMNAAVAGLAGALRDAEEASGGERAAMQSPVLAHPHFERLEAEGIARHGAKIAAVAKTTRERR